MLMVHLYSLLQERGWTQRELAQKVSIRESTISNMCNNASKMLGVNNLNKICNALDCRIEDILEYIPDRKDI